MKKKQENERYNLLLDILQKTIKQQAKHHVKLIVKRFK